MSYANFSQVVSDLNDLNQTIEDLRQRIVSGSGVSYASQDARHVALDGLQCDIGACGNWISALMGLKFLSQEKFGDTRDEEYRKIIRTRLTSGQAEDLMLDYLRNTLTTKVHFKIENLFSNILRVLSATPNRTGFWRISDAMLQQAEIPSRGLEKDILTALANLRNSFHANGMHSKESLSIDINGTRFEFCAGKRVECASWQHVTVIIRANISVLQSILLSKKVLSLRGEIPDGFATTGSP